MYHEEHWSGYAKVYDPLAVGSIDGTDKIPHDKGITRAIESVYNPDISLVGDTRCTLFLGRLHPKVNEDDIKKVFEDYGNIMSCKVIRDLVTGDSKQYAFIVYESEYEANTAHRNGHRRMIRGCEVLVERECGRTMPGWKPRRLGGGFGGRKESGQLRFGCRERKWREPIVPYHLSSVKKGTGSKKS